MKHATFSGKLLIIGFGSIGQGVLPLILRHLDMPAERITIRYRRGDAAMRKRAGMASASLSSR